MDVYPLKKNGYLFIFFWWYRNSNRRSWIYYLLVSQIKKVNIIIKLYKSNLAKNEKNKTEVNYSRRNRW